MINKILLTSAGRYSEKSSSFLGIEGENKANTLLFEFSDGFIDGLGQLYIERGSDIGYVNLIKNENSYELPVMSSLLSKVGEINMQVVITKADGTIIKYDKFTMLVKDAIDTDIPLPEEYPSWTSTISEMLSKTQDAIDEANTISEQLLKDKEDGVFNGKDGKDGKDGFSPIATVTQTDTGATILITDTNGTTIVTVKNGKDGSSGISEETDPIYTSEKSTLALKSELPTKLSQLQNDSEFISSYTETDPTIPTHVKNITQENITNWNNKSEFSGSYNDLTDKPTIPSVEGLATTEQLTQGLATKQDTLTAGDNITIENGVISSTGGGIAELPIATADTLGGIKVGEGLEITDEGVLSAIGGGSAVGSSYTESELLNSQVGYTLTANTSVSINQDITLSQPITDFDEIVFAIALTDKSGSFSNCNWLKLLTSNVVYNNSDSMLWDGSRFSLCTLSTSGVPEVCGVWFKTPSILKIWNTFTKSTSLYEKSKIVIRSIKGIKYNSSSITSAKEFGEFEINQSTGTAITELMPIKVRGNMELSANGRIKLTPNKNYLFIINIKKITFTDSTGTCYHSLYFSNDLENRLYALEFYPEGTSTSYTNIRTLPKSLFTILSATETNNEISLYNSAKATSTPSIKLESIIDTIIVIEI